MYFKKTKKLLHPLVKGILANVFTFFFWSTSSYCLNWCNLMFDFVPINEIKPNYILQTRLDYPTPFLIDLTTHEKINNYFTEPGDEWPLCCEEPKPGLMSSKGSLNSPNVTDSHSQAHTSSPLSWILLQRSNPNRNPKSKMKMTMTQ